MFAPDDVDRPRGILSTADRKWLLDGEAEYEKNHSRQASAARKAAVEERLRHALRDFQLLNEHLPTDSREAIFDLSPVGEAGDREELEEDIQALITFLYAGMGGVQWFNRVLRRGVWHGEVELENADHPLLVDVDTLDVEVIPNADHKEMTREAIEHLENGEPNELTGSQLYALVMHGSLFDAIDVDQLENGIELLEERDPRDE